MMLKLNAMHGMRKMEEWKEYKLSELLEIPIRNGLTKPKAIRGQGVKMIGMKEIFAYDIIRNCDMELVPITDKELASSSIIEEDLLFARQSLTLEGAGKCSIVGSVNDDTVFESHLIRVRINKKLANPYFIYYYFNSRYGKEQIKGLVQQVAAAGIRGKELINLMIKCPSLPTQQKIANILSSLDDKIEVNRRINEQLEELAQALFKSWFVDFEPFKDGEFVESELGMIPKGWKVGELSEIGDIVGEATPSKSNEDYYTENGISWITPKDLSINKNKFIDKGETDITELGYSKCSAKLMPKGSVLFSSRAPIGYIAIAKKELCTNQGFKSVVPKYAGTAFIYFYLKNNVSNIESMASGSTFKEASGALMKSLKVIIPPSSLLQEYEEKVSSIFNKQEYLEEEITHLSNLRDTLLPKLMSGEIDVNEVEI